MLLGGAERHDEQVADRLVRRQLVERHPARNVTLRHAMLPATFHLRIDGPVVLGGEPFALARISDDAARRIDAWRAGAPVGDGGALARDARAVQPGAAGAAGGRAAAGERRDPGSRPLDRAAAGRRSTPPR